MICYRGYYYDNETGFYYLNSRYYDPEIGRFINADGYVSTGQGLLGHNMFAYCLNNPVNKVDPNGNLAIQNRLYCDGLGYYSKGILEKVGESILAITRGATAYGGAGIGIGGEVSATVHGINAAISAVAKTDIFSIEWGKGNIFTGIIDEASCGLNLVILDLTASLKRQHSYDALSQSDCSCNNILSSICIWDRTEDYCKYWKYDDDEPSSKISVSVGAYLGIGASFSIEYDYGYVYNELQDIWGW